ncbi:MAG: insulinase family protein, partial [Bacteroidetes bacterium]|nr:insulinase family protein [Bacteroidota bacterium]
SDNINKLHLPDVNALIEPYTSDQNSYILLEAPEQDAANLPDEKTLLGWVDKPATDVTAYQGVQVGNDVDLLPAEPQSGKIESTQSNISGAETLTLSNGAKVILKNTDFSAGQILFDIYGFGGTSLASDEDYTSAALAGRLVSRSGVSRFSQVELDKILANQGYGLSPYITDYVQGMRGGAAPSRIEQAMKLIHLYFTEPRADSSVWAGLISQEKARLASRVKSPQSVFADTAWAVLHSYNFRAGFPTEARLNAARSDKAFDYYKQRFSDASNFTFVFVGNLDNIGIRSLIKKYIASLPGSHTAQSYKDLHMDPLPGKVTKIIRKGIDDKSTVELVFHGAIGYNPENNLQLNALGEILQLRITERLRMQESSVYSATAAAHSVNYPDGQYGVDVQFTCSSANADKLIAATLDEVEKIKQNGAQPDDIQKFIADETRSMQLKLKQNTFWVDFLSTASRNDEDPGFIKTYIASLNDVTVESTKASANKYLDADNLIKLVQVPESK